MKLNYSGSVFGWFYIVINTFIYKTDIYLRGKQILTDMLMFNLYLVYTILHGLLNTCRGSWVLVATAWRVLSLWMEERPTIWRAAANILNKQSRKTYKLWSFSLDFGRGVNISLL